jgi:mRNA-degrading endonuclease RelE of RelBE toxin-antitoxin system
VILSLDENPARGSVIPEGYDLRHLLYGRRRNVYRIIYAIDERESVVHVLHVRHGARNAFWPNEED